MVHLQDTDYDSSLRTHSSAFAESYGSTRRTYMPSVPPSRL
ncbi:uncharacterized protein METZ01_LOCUS264315, partial [marine metagenome]